MATVLNAFQLAAARLAARAPAAAAPSPAAPPRPVQRGAHQLFHIRTPLRGLDVAGRPTLLQGARQGGPFVIEGSAAAQASNDKRQALRRGSIGPKEAKARASDAPGNDLHTAVGVDKAPTHTGAWVQLDGAPEAVFTPPPDLLEFVRASTVSQVATALGLSRRTAYRLRDGYWPRDYRAILHCWEAYKGRHSSRQSGWMLRRVDAGGKVRHAGHVWAAPTLALRVGQTVAVARTCPASLVAQTLDLPAERCVLSPLPSQECA